MVKRYDTGGAIPDDDADDQDGQQVAGNLPARPAGPGGDQPNPSPFPTKQGPVPFGQRLSSNSSPPIAPGQSNQSRDPNVGWTNKPLDINGNPRVNPRELLQQNSGKSAEGAIPDGSGTDQQTASIDDALQTVDDVMQYGYQKSGLTGGGGDQQAAIPDQSGVQAMDAGGDVQPAIPMTAQIPTVADQHASEMNQVNADAARRAISNVKKRSSGTQSYADGGDVEDANGEPTAPATPQPAPPTPVPAQGAQGGQQNVQQILRLIQGADAMPPQQAQQLEQQTGAKDPNVAKALAVHQLAQTAGPDAAFSYVQSLRKNYDLMRTNAAVKANMGRLDLSTQAANQAMTNIVDGTDTRFTPAPGGKGVVVTVNRIGRGKAAPTKGYADGGDVEDDNGNPAIPEQPTGDQSQGAQPNTPDAQQSDDSFNQGINKFMLSIPQYYQMLMGKEGMFDHIWNAGPGQALSSVAKGPGMQPQGNAEQANTYAGSITGAPATPSVGALPAASQAIQQNTPSLLNPGASGMTPEGQPQPAAPAPEQGGAPAATPAAPPQQSNVGLPQFNQQRPAAPQTPGQTAPAAGGGVQVYSDENPPQGNPPGKLVDPYAQLKASYGPDAVAAAQAAFPNDRQAQVAQLTGEREKQKGFEAQQANTRLLSEGRVAAAGARVQGLLGVQELKNTIRTQEGARRAATEIQVAAMRSGSARDSMLAKQFVGYLSSGQQPPDNLLQWASQAVASSEGQPQQQQPAPRKDFTQTPGAVANVPQSGWLPNGKRIPPGYAGYVPDGQIQPFKQ